MNILIAPDSFKGSLSSSEIISILKKKLLNSGLKLIIDSQELADGGEGSIDVFKNIPEFEKIKIKVLNPLGKEIDAYYLLNKKRAVAYIELAKASGLSLLKGDLDIMSSNSSGTGQLIKDAIENGANEIILFLGGSATNDAGLGILDALDLEFFDIKNRKLSANPYNLRDIVKIDDSKIITKRFNINFILAVDVNNPFLGANGAAQVYAKQKGANQQQINFLDEAMRSFSEIIFKKYSIDIQKIIGAGAAGGIAGSLHAILAAKILSGADIILKKVGLERKIKEADIVITGEGKIDVQTQYGKTPMGVAGVAKKYDKPVIAIAGTPF